MGEIVELRKRAHAAIEYFGHKFEVEVLFRPPLAPASQVATISRDGRHIGDLILVLDRGVEDGIPAFSLHPVAADLTLFDVGEFCLGDSMNEHAIRGQMQEFVIGQLTLLIEEQLLNLIYGKDVIRLSEEPPWNVFPTAMKRVAMASTAYEPNCGSMDSFTGVMAETLFNLADDIWKCTAEWIDSVDAGEVELPDGMTSAGERIRLFADSVLAAWAEELDDEDEG